MMGCSVSKSALNALTVHWAFKLGEANIKVRIWNVLHVLCGSICIYSSPLLDALCACVLLGSACKPFMNFFL